MAFGSIGGSLGHYWYWMRACGNAALACALLFALATTAGAQSVQPLKPPDEKPPLSHDEAEAKMALFKGHVVKDQTETKNEDGTIAYSSPDEKDTDFTEKTDGTIVERIGEIKDHQDNRTIITYSPNGDITKQPPSRVDKDRQIIVTDKTTWHENGNVTVTQINFDSHSTLTTTVTTIKPDGSTQTNVTKALTSGGKIVSSSEKSGSTPPTKTATGTPPKATTPTPTPPSSTTPAPTTPKPTQSATPGTTPAQPTTPGTTPAPQTTPAPVPPSGTTPSIPSTFVSPATVAYSPFSLGFDIFAVPLRRDIVFKTPSFTEGGFTFPESSSTITHRTAGVAPMLDFSYETPVSLANERSDVGFGLRFGGFVSGGDSEKEFNTRISTSGSWIINPYIQYRPRVANLWTLFFEGGVWVEDDCFSEFEKSFSPMTESTRIQLHGFSAAPELGIGASAPIPWLNLPNVEFQLGIHWIGPSNISEQMPIIGLPVEETIQLNRRWTVGGEAGVHYRF